MSGRRGAVSLGQLAAVLLILAGVGGGGFAISRLLSIMRSLQTDRTVLTQRSQAIREQMQGVERERDALAKERDQLAADRDNLLSQFQRMTKENEQVAQERTLLEQVFRRTAGDRLDLENRLIPLEAQHEALVQEHAALQEELDRVEQQLDEAQKRTSEKALRDRLAQEERERKKLAASLRTATRKAQRSAERESKAQSQMDKVQGRLTELEDKYAKLMADNRTLRKQADQMPLDVTNLARGHERLIKDLVDSHYNMGVMLAKRKDYVRAAKEFQRVVELRPTDPDAHFNLGIIYSEHLPNRERAIEFFRRFLAMSPTGQDASYAKQYIATWQAWAGQDRLE